MLCPQSPHRCLICYCKTEVVTASGAGEEGASPLNKVITCNGAKCLQSEDKGFEVADCLSSPREHQLSKDLRAIFTLKKLLQVPQEELASHLSKWGSPGGWITLCSRCNTTVSNAQMIYHQILDATRILKGIKGDIVGMIKESLDCEPSPNIGEVSNSECLEVTVKIREFVRGCEHIQEITSDPFISGDLKANELLNLQEQGRFSISSRKDEADHVQVGNGEGSKGGSVPAEIGAVGAPDEDQPPVLKKPRIDKDVSDALESFLGTETEHDNMIGKVTGEDGYENMEVEEEMEVVKKTEKEVKPPASKSKKVVEEEKPVAGGGRITKSSWELMEEEKEGADELVENTTKEIAEKVELDGLKVEEEKTEKKYEEEKKNSEKEDYKEEVEVTRWRRNRRASKPEDSNKVVEEVVKETTALSTPVVAKGSSGVRGNAAAAAENKAVEEVKKAEEGVEVVVKKEEKEEQEKKKEELVVAKPIATLTPASVSTRSRREADPVPTPPSTEEPVKEKETVIEKPQQAVTSLVKSTPSKVEKDQEKANKMVVEEPESVKVSQGVVEDLEVTEKVEDIEDVYKAEFLKDKKEGEKEVQVVMVDEEEDVEQNIQSSSILDSLNEASNVPVLLMTQPSSIQLPQKLSNCELQGNKNEEISVTLMAEGPVENQEMEEPSMPPPDIKPANTIQLSFTIPKLPVMKKEQVPEPAKIETPWMVDVRPNIFAKRSEQPKNAAGILKSSESPVLEKMEGIVTPKVKNPETVDRGFQSKAQPLDVEIIAEVQTSNIVYQTIKSDNLGSRPPKPEVRSTSNAEVAIRQEAYISTLIEDEIKQAARSRNLVGKTSPQGVQSQEIQKAVIKPRTCSPSNRFSQLSTTSKPKYISSPPQTNATINRPSVSTMEDILGDLDPFVKELLSVPASQLPPMAKAPSSISTPSSSVKQPVQQQVQTRQPQNKSGIHGFDKEIIQGNGLWRHYCRCGISYVNSANLSRHITNMSKTTAVVPRNAHPNPDTPQNFQCFICKFASSSVEVVFNDMNLLKAHLDQMHQTKIIASPATTKSNGGSSQSQNQILNNDGSFKDKSMELKRQLSFIPIQRIAEAASLPLPSKNIVVRPPPAPKQQQPVQPKNVTPYSPITITTTALMSSKSVETKTCTPKNIVVRPSPTPRQQQAVQPKHLRSRSPVTITTTAIKPLRSALTKPPSPSKGAFKPRWYVCRHCLKANPPQMKRFTCLAHLTNHIHSEHGGWMCPTPKCEKIFSTWMHLIAHRRKQTCCKDANAQISEPCQAQAQVQVLETPPITMPKLAARPKNTLERYLQVTKVERKPAIKPKILVAEDDDEVICIDD